MKSKIELFNLHLCILFSNSKTQELFKKLESIKPIIGNMYGHNVRPKPFGCQNLLANFLCRNGKLLFATLSICRPTMASVFAVSIKTK